MPAGYTSNLINELVMPTSAPVLDITDELFAKKNITVQLLRLDQIDPLLGGNKAFKLIPNLIHAQTLGLSTVLSFGGAYSNHIHALAEAGKRFNFKTIAVIRGDDGQADTHTLQFALSKGMQLIRVSRQDYRRRSDTQFIDDLKASLGKFYLIPEGGANAAGVRGSMQLASVIANSLGLDGKFNFGSSLPDEILLACGTGTTMAGLIAGLQTLATDSLPFVRNLPFVRGIAVLKQGQFLRDDVARYQQTLVPPGSSSVCWEIETDYHWGGYARFPKELAAFVRKFEQKHNILLDPVYTAKMMSAVYQRAAAGLYSPGSHLLLLHTGGLQGRMSGQH